MSEEQIRHAYADWADNDEQNEDVVPEVCSCLRTKTAFGSLSGSPHQWQEGKSSTAVYWCLVTMANAGPDERFAHPHQCRFGRSCFRGEE